MDHEYFMQRCIQLAELGLGNTAPNPMVGCVIVYDSKIIGEGYHQKFGRHHAEINAIASIKDKSLLAKSALYVTLEPCSHYGKTPPCSDAIIRNKIPEVIIGNRDPFALVNGSGIKKLKDTGIKVTEKVLENECRFMNRRFFVFQEKKRPYIILKWAQSADGFIASDTKSFVEKQMMENTPSSPFGGQGTWISNEYSRMLSHKWRSEESAIMVGTNTAKLDNPRLNVRDWTGNNPLRLVLDKDLRLSPSLNLFNQKIKTIVFTSREKKSENNLEYIKIDFDKDIIKQVLNFLYEQNIQSVIIEGGNHLLTSFIKSGYWDEARIFTSPNILSGGINAPEFKGKILSSKKIKDDTLNIYKN